MFDKKNLLIGILLDKTASDYERDDAAMYLAKYNDDSVTKALLIIASNPNDNETVLETCGETLGLIWLDQNMFNKKAYDLLTRIARHGAYTFIKANKPEWVKQFELDRDTFAD